MRDNTQNMHFLMILKIFINLIFQLDTAVCLLKIRTVNGKSIRRGRSDIHLQWTHIKHLCKFIYIAYSFTVGACQANITTTY